VGFALDINEATSTAHQKGNYSFLVAKINYFTAANLSNHRCSF
jgi:hypothetical protein